MIEIKEKKDCCGCWACVQVCPKQCIAMREDEEGFVYPQVDTSLCVDCGLCEKVCPVQHPGAPRRPLETYAAMHRDEDIRRASSSGGVFTALAEAVIDEGGVVFGAKFDRDWSVVHGRTETRDGLSAFRGSKYVQSRMEDNYVKVRECLQAGRKVLFSGTPCQVAGLRLFLRKEYEGLLTVDFICHGVPSPGVWREYLDETVARMCEKNTVCSHPIHGRNALIKDISFRNKTFGWQKFSFALALSATEGSGENSVLLSPLNKNLFIRGFLSDLYLRPSCHACPSKCLTSGSDITIGDYWGIRNVMPDFDDDQGVSAVMVNTDKGEAAFSSLDLDCRRSDYATVVRFNPAVERSATWQRRRKWFYKLNCSFGNKVRILHKRNTILRLKVCAYKMKCLVLGK